MMKKKDYKSLRIGDKVLIEVYRDGIGFVCRDGIFKMFGHGSDAVITIDGRDIILNRKYLKKYVSQ